MIPPPDHPVSKQTLRAFTLVELLSVIAIVGVLAALVIASLGYARTNARRTQCASNLRQLFVGASLYAQDHKDLVVPNLPVLPPNISVTWVEVLAPYAQVPVDAVDAQNVRPGYIFACPESTNLTKNGAMSDYAKNYQVNGTNSGTRRMRSIATPTKVVFFADSQSPDNNGLCGRDIGVAGNIRPTNRHNGQAAVLYFDGHVTTTPSTSLANNVARLPWNPDATQ